MTVGKVVDQALTKIIQRFFIQPHIRFFARLNANQIVVGNKQMFAHVQPAIDQVMTSSNALCQAF
ncbi:hypothetical protein D3C76_1650040 [compost metagenome]